MEAIPRRPYPPFSLSHQKSLSAPRRARLEKFLALLFTTVATWPLLWHLPQLTRLADPTLDDCIYYWNDWWVLESLRHGTNPFFCSEVFHPHGTSLVLSPLAFPLALFSAPFQMWLDPLHGAALATKLCMFASFPIAILGMARFLRRTFGMSPWPAFIAGCMFAFVPFRMLHLGRVHYLMGALVPWFLERLVAGLRDGELRAAFLCGAIFALAGACDASLLPEMGLAAGAVLLYEWQRRGELGPKLFLRRAALCLGSGGVLLAPLLIPMLLELRANPGVDVVSQLHFEGRPDPIQLAFSPDLNNLSWYLAPALHEGLLGAGSGLAEGSHENRVIWRAMHGGREASGIAVGASLLLLLGTGFACVRGMRKELWPFLGLAVLGFLLALGPFRQLGSDVLRMPHYWLAKFIPGLAAGRYVAANLRLFYLGLAILAAFGMRRMEVPRIASPPTRFLACAAVAGAIALAGWSARTWEYRPIRHEPVYQAIASDPGVGAIIDLPHDFRPNLRRMALGQILHRRAMCGGPVTRVRPEVVRAFTEELLAVARFQDPPPARSRLNPGLLREVAENQSQLVEKGVRFVILRRRLFKDATLREQIEAYLEAHEGLEIQEIDGHLLVRVQGPLARPTSGLSSDD